MLYKQVASRDMEYVVFEVKPSAEDISATNDAMSEIYEEFATTTNIKSFLSKNSERAYSEYWYKQGELNTVSAAVASFVDGAKKGDVSTILSDGDHFYGVRVLAESKKPETIQARVIAAHGAIAVTDSLKTVLRLSEPFAMTKANIFAGLEDLLDAPLNTPRLYNSPMYGPLVAEVVEKSDLIPVKQVAILEKTALASKETFNNYYSQANRFATITGGTYEGYKKAIDSTGVYSHVMNNVTESTANYGSVSQAKEITRWVYDAKKGKASNIITVNNNFFFVVALKDIREEGYKNVNDVAPSIHEKLRTKALQDLTRDRIALEMKGKATLEEIADPYDLTTFTEEGVSFNSNSRNLEPVFVGAVANAPVGEICGPVPGIACVYVFKVTNRETGSFYTAEDARNNETQKALYTSQQIIPVMMENAEVKDNRAHFF